MLNEDGEPMTELIECLKAYWRASGELANVERRYGTEFEREAHRDFNQLEKTIKVWLKNWNDDVPEGQQAIVKCLCIDQESGCELFYPTRNKGDSDGRCLNCAIKHREHMVNF